MPTNPSASSLVNWTHTLGRPAVCLGRLITTAPTPVVVLSEIAQNPDALGISGDFAAAATAAWTALAIPQHTADLEQVTWYAHHGPFSSYDPTGPETLTEVTLTRDGASFVGDLAGHRLLSSTDAQHLIEEWALEPVTVALGRLEHR